jgi:Ca2+-transporting ATPase
LARDGPNAIDRGKRTPVLMKLLSQFKSPFVLMLVGASVLAGLVGEITDMLAIAAILIINGVIGFFQELRAERALEALRSMTAPRTRVFRDGEVKDIAAADVVVGDLLVFEAGDIVAADARVIEANEFTVNEAPLTGESVPVRKTQTPDQPQTPLAERHNAVFMGTSVAGGTGRACVVATAMRTELGKIAHLIEKTEAKQTPLQKRLKRVSNILLVGCLAIVAIVAALGFARGTPWLEVVLIAVSLAVAAVPEGLPAIVTIALALGVQRMAARNVLVRKLASVETLGCSTVICTDKTGTLTTGVMAVREIWPEDNRVLIVAASCCDASLSKSGDAGVGDTTELAILLEARRRGIDKEEVERANPRVYTNPFSSERRRMSVYRADQHLYVKGALEEIQRLSAKRNPAAEEEAQRMADRALRVLAIAEGDTREESGLRLIGLVGIADPPRSEVIEAVAQAREAGIRTVMITGDHPLTARAIAREIGILIAEETPEGRVHARATAEDKLQIVRALKHERHVVAMTGDGVNDAPALKEADIGIAMGKTGTEVTREAADMVLADDNFASIVAAVREGRGIYENIRKALAYLLAGNFGELLLMLVAAAMGLPSPLVPLQLLWINLVTDGLPALALVADPVDTDAMIRPPRPFEEQILGKPQWIMIAVTGAMQAGCSLAVYYWALQYRDLADARNLAFSTLVFGELFRAFAARSDRKLFWQVGAFSNVLLLAVVIASASLQLAIHHIPFTQRLFDLEQISMQECLLTLLVGLIPVSALELYKLARYRMRRSTQG